TIADMMPFAKLMGVTILEASAERVIGEIAVREELCTTGRILHGGAAMAFADTLGGVGAFLALPEGAKATTTIGSETTFLCAARLAWGSGKARRPRPRSRAKPIFWARRRSARRYAANARRFMSAKAPASGRRASARTANRSPSSRKRRWCFIRAIRNHAAFWPA